MDNNKNEIITEPANKIIVSDKIEMQEVKNDTIQSEINIAESIINWKAKKTLVTTSNHNGTVKLKSGFVIIDEGVLNGGEFVIDMTSVSNKDLGGAMKEKLEGHLASNDFFNVANFPTAKLIMKKITSLENSRFSVTADLTIKGRTNEVNFDAVIEEIDNVISLKTDFEIDRTLWNIRFGSGTFFENLGDNLIDDNIEFSIIIVVKK